MSPPPPDSVVDATGAAVDLKAPAARIVSLVPSLTETVCSLGAEAALVGRTPYCVEPESIRDRVPLVGGPVGIDGRRIRALSPDLILTCKEENDREEVLALRASGIAVYVAWPRTVADVAHLLGDLGALLGRRSVARAASQAVRGAALRLAARAGDAVHVTIPVWLDPPRAVGTGTYTADLVAHAGGAVVPAVEGYPAIPREGLDAEVVLLPDEPFRFERAHIEALGLGRSAAARSGRVHEVDGRQLFWYGPRTARALTDLAELLGPAS